MGVSFFVLVISNVGDAVENALSWHQQQAVSVKHW